MVKPMHMVLLVLTMTVPFSARAASCVATSKAPGATILPIKPAGAPIQITGIHLIDNCETIQVTGGEVCFLVGDLLAKKPCIVKNKNEKFSLLTDAGARAATGEGGVMTALLGAPTVTRGGLKAQGTAPLSGFPYSEVLASKGDLVISTRRVTEGPVTGFTIEDKTARKRLNAAIEAGGVRVAGRDVVAGHQYNWTAQVAGSARAGSFSVVALADEPELAAELAAAEKAPDLVGNPAAVAVARAVILYNHQFIFDALRMVEPMAPPRQ